MSKIHEIRPSSWDHLKLHQILRDWRDKRVLVIGDVGVDRYVLGLVERISPEAPVPIVLVQEEQLKLGLAANVADNVQALEAEAVLVGVVGKDRSAQDFRVLLKGAGVSSGSLITDSSRRTVLKERVVSDRQQLLRVDYESQHGLEPRVEKQVLSKISELLRSCDVVLLEDYAKGFLSKSLASEIFRRARAAGKIVTVDPHPKSPLGNYRGAHVLT
ncbi:MAG: bifunctional heptose 7-phosphate kinase/heptose 1-phosphate adenyltransferase, partial [Bdellovibrionota bacterium]